MPSPGGLCLGHFPSAILADITCLLTASDVYALAYLCGDRRLCTKLFQGGVIAVHFDLFSSEKCDLKLLANFKSLLSASFDGQDLKRTLPLEELPSTLQTLQISGAHRHWLSAKASPSFVADPSNRFLHAHGMAAFDFKQHFDNLRHLQLIDSGPKASPIDSVSHLVAFLLPATLETLELADIQLVPATFWRSLPNNLKILSLDEGVYSNFLKSLRHYAPHIHFDCLTVLDLDPSIASVPVRTVKVQQFETSPELLAAFVKHFPQTGLPPSASSYFGQTSCKPYLTSFQTRLWSQESKTQDDPSFCIRWPESLQCAKEDLAAPNFQLYNHMPPNVTDLRIRMKGRSEKSFPGGLISLTLSTDPFRDFSADIMNSPTSLTSLTINGRGAWKQEYMSLLPGSLTSLEVSLANVSLLPLNPSFFESIPPALTHLKMACQCDDTVLKHMPLSIAVFVPEMLYLTGAIPIVFSDPKKAVLSNRGFLTREVSGEYCFQFLPYKLQNPPPARSAIFNSSYHKIPLPESATELIVAYGKPTDTFDGSANLPNLTSLKFVGTRSSANLESLNAPNLTRLEADSFSIRNTIKYPKQITQLVLEGDTKFVECPHDFLAQMRSIECIGTSNIAMDCLLAATRLEVLSMTRRGDLTVSKLPTTLTDLTLKSEDPDDISLSALISRCPKLKRLALDAIVHDEFEVLPKDFESLSCHSVALSSLPIDPPSQLGALIGDSTFNFSHWMVKSHLMQRYPFIKKIDHVVLADPETALLFPALAFMFASVAFTDVTKIIFGMGVTLPPRFGKCLPKTVTNLDVMMASGITNATPYHLPSSITELKINGSTFPTPAYQHLPKALVCLELTSSKFLNRHASALPSSLQKFTLISDRGALPLRIMEHLPVGLTYLDWPYRSRNCCALGLPPNLRTLKGGQLYESVSYPSSLTDLSDSVVDIDVLAHLESMLPK